MWVGLDYGPAKGTIAAHTGSAVSVVVWDHRRVGAWGGKGLRTTQVGEHVPDVSYPCCLAMSGSMLFCAGYRNDMRNSFLLKLDNQTMRFEHTLRLDGLLNLVEPAPSRHGL